MKRKRRKTEQRQEEMEKSHEKEESTDVEHDAVKSVTKNTGGK